MVKEGEERVVESVRADEGAVEVHTERECGRGRVWPGSGGRRSAHDKLIIRREMGRQRIAYEHTKALSREWFHRGPEYRSSGE